MQPLRPTLLAFAAAFFLVGPAFAWAAENQAGALTFTWNAPETCPSRQQVQAELARLLGGTIQIAHEDALDVHASVEHGRTWSVTLATRRAGRADRRRVIEAPSCQSLAQATALIVALMIDPDAVAAHSQDGPGAPAPAASQPAIAAAPVAPSSEARPFLVSLHTEGRLGTLPGVDVGLGLAVGMAGRRWSLELRGNASLRRDQAAHLSAVPDAGARFNILAGALSGCLNLSQTRLAFGPCAVAEAGVVSAQGYGADAGYNKRAPWVALGGGGYTSVPLGYHLEAALHLDVLVPLWRPSYVFSGAPGVVFQAPAVGASALASLRWRF